MNEDEARELKLEIEDDIQELAKKIEKFCVLENTHYIVPYKNKLRAIHSLFEDL